MGDRDSNGRFTKGHRFTQSTGIKTGRKKLPTTEVKEFLNIAAPGALHKINELCQAGNLDACKYLCDRQWGKPGASVDLNHSGEVKKNITYICQGTEEQIADLKNSRGD